MKSHLLKLILTLFVFGPVPSVNAQDKSAEQEKKIEERIVQVQKLLTDHVIAFKDFPDEMPLVKFLAVLESRLPEERKVWLRLDEEAFGKDLPKIAAARINFPACNATLNWALRKAIAQVPVDMDIAVRPAGIVLTTPRRSSAGLRGARSGGADAAVAAGVEEVGSGCGATSSSR